MRDSRFISKHRGGSLTNKKHQKLILWACICAENALNLCDEKIDVRLKNALLVAKEWEKGEASVAMARDASSEAIKVANETTNPIGIAVARSIGHAVATAHMADHALVAAYYALKVSRIAGGSVDDERKWQNDKLPSGIRYIVITARNTKEKGLKI